MLQTSYGWTQLCVDLTLFDTCTNQYHTRS